MDLHHAIPGRFFWASESESFCVYLFRHLNQDFKKRTYIIFTFHYRLAVEPLFNYNLNSGGIGLPPMHILIACILQDKSNCPSSLRL